ncbi:porin [Paraburkholderia sp. C35]|uniref:porin n=1 Tax=Paraburkholderia sp. C35 TaxID=2126993 RepID=UPI000D69AB33|nr:porin [Paraburkholderia sp. C35]
MKKMIIAFSALTGIAFNAYAQSSVTLYGIIDEGLLVNTNAGGHRQYALTSGNVSGSRWGVRGSEDLGGNLSAIFVLESGFNGSTGSLGQNGTFFGRQVYVGFTSPTWGTATLGRQYPTEYDYVGPLTAGGDWAASGAGFGAHPADLDNLDGTYRFNNSVKYRSPSYAGFSFGAQYSVGGVAGNFTRNEIYSLGTGYNAGPVTIGAAFTYAKNPNFSVFGTRTNDSATGSNMSGPVISGFASAATQQIAAVGASYKIGAGSISAAYSNTVYGKLGSTAIAGGAAPLTRGSAVFNIYETSAKYYLTPTLQVAAAYAYTQGSSLAGQSGAKYNQVDLGANYFLSKRTDLYALAFFQKASGHDSTGHSAVAQLAFASASTSDRQLIGLVGIRHKF